MAASLRARYNLSLTDAFQVAVALKAGCDAVLSEMKNVKAQGGGDGDAPGSSTAD
ncbi:MAG: hypothetical protein IMHGJWDQ_002253 [Candidatus Fervidibacter sp.]